MAYTSGSATDWADLAGKLHTWLVGTAGWTSLAYTAGTLGVGGLDMRMQAPGNGTGKNLYINIGSVITPAASCYSWDVRAAIGNTSGSSFGSNPGESNPTYLNLWESSITYWIFANDRRLIVIAKCNTVYLTLYAGMYLPWATAAQYPFPLFVGATSGISQPYSSTRSSQASFFDPAGTTAAPSSSDWNGAKLRDPSGLWIPVVHNLDSTSSYDRVGSNITLPSNFPYIWPYDGRARSLPVGNWGAGWFDIPGPNPNSPGAFCTLLQPTAQGERLLLPVYILNGSLPGGYGALDGCFFPAGGGLTPEQVGSYSGTSYIMFPNVFRVASARSFVAIQEA